MLHSPGLHVPRFQKTYLSRAVTRTMGMDHPIGDPFGGPAYGERNDPISAVISIGTLFATGGAVLAGTATLMTGLAFAGAAISLVGNLTGNSTLSKIGMVAGLAGGVGMLAESAGMFSSGTLGETFGYGSGAPTGAPGAPLAQTPDVGANVQPNVTQPAALPESNIVQNAGAGVPNAVPEGGFNPASQVNQNLAASPTSNLNPLNMTGVDPNALSQTELNTVFNNAPSVMTPTADVVGAPSAPGAPVGGFESIPNGSMPGQPGSGWNYFADGTSGVAVSPEGKYFLNGSQVTGAGGGAMGLGDYAGQAWGGIKDIGSSFMELAKSNSGAAYMLGMGIQSVGDVVSGKADAQIKALESQGELSKAQADKLRFEMEEYKRKIAQRNSNYTNVQNPLNNWTPNFNVAPPPAGLISGAMPGATGG